MELDAAENDNKCPVTLMFLECEVFRHLKDERDANQESFEFRLHYS